MNRRTSLKNIAFLGIASFFLSKCNGVINTEITIDELDEYKSLIAELAETIIPHTDTPGAKDAKVEDYIILMVKECDNKKDQYNFLKGLTKLQAYTMENYKVGFVDCSESDKIQVLNYFKEHRIDNSTIDLINKIKRKIFGYSFYSHLHELTVSGFCTSELGATQVLAYDHIPGRYKGCIPYQENQKTWAT